MRDTVIERNNETERKRKVVKKAQIGMIETRK